MKKIIPVIAVLFLLASCKTSKDYLLRSNEDKTLYDVVKQLNKHADDENASKALAEVYTQVQQKHLDKIETFKSYSDLNRWDKISAEYSTLQNMYEAIANSDAAAKLVKANSYQKQIDSVKQAAAEDYYQIGLSYLQRHSRDDAKLAYSAFKKAGKWVNDYKDSKAKMDVAYENAIVNVLINPVQDNSVFISSGWNNNFSNDYLSQNLVRDLGGKYASQYPARFYTERETNRNDIQPDWVVDLTLREMDIPRPTFYNYSRNLSKQIETGRDTSGRIIYQTVYATLNIQKQSFNARAQMDILITEVATRKNILYNSYSDTYNWQQEVASYSGDSRALSSSDWTLINNSYNQPNKEDIMNELYRGIYPQIKNRISNAANW